MDKDEVRTSIGTTSEIVVFPENFLQPGYQPTFALKGELGPRKIPIVNGHGHPIKDREAGDCYMVMPAAD